MKIYVFRGPCGKCIFSYNFTDRTKLMILFYLQRLGAQHSELCFFNFWKIKWRKKFLNFFSKILCFFQLLVVLCYIFMETDGKIIFWRSLLCWQLNSLQNYVCFNCLGQGCHTFLKSLKCLWKKILVLEFSKFCKCPWIIWVSLNFSKWSNIC